MRPAAVGDVPKVEDTAQVGPADAESPAGLRSALAPAQPPGFPGAGLGCAVKHVRGRFKIAELGYMPIVALCFTKF